MGNTTGRGSPLFAAEADFWYTTKLMSPLKNRIIGPEESQELMRAGWYPADLHVHTCYSHDVLPSRLLEPLTLYQKARKKGFRFITFTDHDSMEAYDRIGWTRENLVPAVEITIKDIQRVGHSLHINVYQLQKAHFQELLKIARLKRNLETFLEYLKTNKLPFIYNHPFWYEHGERPSYSVIKEILRIFPATEYNMHRVWQKNSLTLALAGEYGKGIIAATDTHIGDIGKAYTLARGETFPEYYDNIVQGDVCLCARDLTIDLLKHEIDTWIDLIFNIDLVRLEKMVHLRIRALDYLMNLFLKGALTNYPALRRTAEHFFSAIARSGVPAFCYLKLQNFLVYKMNRQLRLAD